MLIQRVTSRNKSQHIENNPSRRRPRAARRGPQDAYTLPSSSWSLVLRHTSAIFRPAQAATWLQWLRNTLQF